MRPFFRIVRGLVVGVCLLPCATAGVLAVERKVKAPPPKPCSIEATELSPTSTERKSANVIVGRAEGKHIAFVADTDEQEIVAFDADEGRVLAREAIGGSPSHMLLDSDGLLYVTARDLNVVRVFEPSPAGVLCGNGPMLRPVAEMKTGAEPVALAETPDRASIVVVTGWGHSLEAFSKKSHERTFAIDLPREPRAVVVDDKGRRAFVSHATGAPTVVDLIGARGARRIELAPREGSSREIIANSQRTAAMVEASDFGLLGLIGTGATMGTVDDEHETKKPKKTPPPRSATQGFALASFEGRVLLPEVLVQPGEMPEPTKLEAPQLTGYGISAATRFEIALGPATAHVAVVEANSETVLSESTRLIVDDRRCLLPRAAAIDPTRHTLLVACLGTNEVDEFDARAESPTTKLRGRWIVPSGPTGLAVFDERIAVWSAFDRVLTIIGRDTNLVHTSMEAKPRAPTPFEVGRKIFHASGNPAISSDGRACASCHPDGRDDGLTWTSPDGPRQTPMLAGRLADTAPFGWTGASATVREHLQQTLKRLDGRGLNDRATYALLTYLSKMKTPPRAPKSDDAKVARGRAIFDSYETGCSGCHTLKDGKPIGDGDVHDVGSMARGDSAKELATPSLEFVGGTGPYFHDGRYATLGDLLRKTDGKMGSTSHLSPADLEALTSYLESL